MDIKVDKWIAFNKKATSVGTTTVQTNKIKLEKYRILEEASNNNTQIL